MASKPVQKPTAIKPVKEALSKNALVNAIAADTAMSTKDVKKVLASLEGQVLGSVHKRGVGSFALPGLFKVVVVKVPAKPKRKGIDPFTKEERVFAAKPASVRVKLRPLKKLRAAAA